MVGHWRNSKEEYSTVWDRKIGVGDNPHTYFSIVANRIIK